MSAPAPESVPPLTSMPPTARETQRPVSAATPGQALSPDPADFAYHVRATAFNVLTGKMAGDERSVPRSERDAIARAVVDAVEPLIRADERAVAAQEPHAAPELQAVESVYLYHWRFDRGEEYGLFRDKADAEAAAEARRAESPGEGLFEVLGMAILGRPEPKPAPELADAMRESRLRAEVITEILDAFGPSGSGHTARVGQVQIAKWRTRAGLTS